MKRNFYIAVGLIVILIIALLSYGVYLNRRSENNITQRMNERRILLRGAKVQNRSIFPVIKLDLINLYSNEMVDVSALIEGRISKKLFSQRKNGRLKL